MQKKIDLLLKRGILATDERLESLGKKFKKYGIENIFANRVAFRSQLYNTPNLENFIGGIIFHKEIFAEDNLIKICREKKILIGIKLDEGLSGEHGNYISEGINNLENEIKKYKLADFAKWRCLFTCNSSQENIEKNCAILKNYAEICLKNQIIPIVEPEILWENYTIKEMANFAKKLYSVLLPFLNEKMILKCSFITPGKNYASDIEESARTTVDIFEEFEKKIPGVVFFSGGHNSEESILLLKKIQDINKNHAFTYSFSFGRALTNNSLKEFAKKSDIQKSLIDQLTKLK